MTTDEIIIGTCIAVSIFMVMVMTDTFEKVGEMIIGDKHEND